MNVEPSAFVDKSGAPARDALEATLGAAYHWWEALEVRLAIDHDPLLADWTYSGRRHGWALRLKHRDRPIVYLTPLAGRFRANIAIPERALIAALEADLPGSVLAIVASAPVHVEGRAVRFEVASEDDVAAVLFSRGSGWRAEPVGPPALPLHRTGYRRCLEIATRFSGTGCRRRSLGRHSMTTSMFVSSFYTLRT